MNIDYEALRKEINAAMGTERDEGVSMYTPEGSDLSNSLVYLFNDYGLASRCMDRDRLLLGTIELYEGDLKRKLAVLGILKRYAAGLD